MCIKYDVTEGKNGLAYNARKSKWHPCRVLRTWFPNTNLFLYKYLFHTYLFRLLDTSFVETVCNPLINIILYELYENCIFNHVWCNIVHNIIVYLQGVADGGHLLSSESYHCACGADGLTWKSESLVSCIAYVESVDLTGLQSGGMMRGRGFTDTDATTRGQGVTLTNSTTLARHTTLLTIIITIIVVTYFCRSVSCAQSARFSNRC